MENLSPCPWTRGLVTRMRLVQTTHDISYFYSPQPFSTARFSLLFEVRTLRRTILSNPQFVNIYVVTRMLKTVVYPFNGQHIFYIKLDFPISMTFVL